MGDAAVPSSVGRAAPERDVLGHKRDGDKETGPKAHPDPALRRGNAKPETWETFPAGVAGVAEPGTDPSPRSPGRLRARRFRDAAALTAKGLHGKHIQPAPLLRGWVC